MLNKSMMIKLLVFAMILVGCASSDVVTEKAKKGESSKVQEEKGLIMIHQQKLSHLKITE